MRNRISQLIVAFTFFIAVVAFSVAFSVALQSNQGQGSAQTSTGQSSSGQQSSTSQSSSDQTSTSQSSAGQQTLDGCLVREEHAIYVMPASGEKTKIASGNPDVASHMGEQVHLTGSSSGSSQPSSQSSATSSGGSSSGSSGNDFVVTKVDVVAHTCPADIQARIDQDKKSQSQPK